MSSSPHPCITVSSPPLIARYHNSALSIWLSVDPMSDKYPSMSPYTYCANNPVRLVDPNGREWLDIKEDTKKYLQLKARAIKARDNYSEGTEEYNRIQEGIEGLDFMAQDKERKYTFTEFYKDSYESKSDKAGYIKREGDPKKGTYHICYKHDDNSSGFSENEMGRAWHETIHLTRALKATDSPYSIWATGEILHDYGIQGYVMNTDGRLSYSSTFYKRIEEFAAFKSQQLVYPNSMPTPVGCIMGHISTNEQINAYIEKNY